MRLYRALLRLYPASFRHEYGREMVADFVARRRHTAGAAAVAWLWLDTAMDLVSSAARVHLDILRQDVRYSWRSLRRQPGFTATAMLVAALGIGAATAAFTITDYVLIRPLPFRAPDRLVDLWQDESNRGITQMELSPANYFDWKAQSQSFEGMAASRGLSANLTGTGEPEPIDGAAVTADLFPLLGVEPAVGRIFTVADDTAGAPRTLILSDGFWAARFARDRGVLGTKVLLDGIPYTVIGVMPADFHYPNRDAEVWTPMQFARADLANRSSNGYLHVIARLKPGVDLEQARAEMRGITARLARAYPNDAAGVGATVLRLRDEMSSGSRLVLAAVDIASLCLLLIACTNLASLLLVRGLVRRKELAMRAVLGAGRERLARQVVTESALLALGGGAAGILLAVGAVQLLERLVPTSLPIAEAPALDGRMLALAGLVTLATGIGFGAWPVVRLTWRSARRWAPADDLADGARAGSSRDTERLRSTMVLLSVAGSVVLLVCTGLLLRALWRVQAVDPGFRATGVLTARTSLPMPKYEDASPRDVFYRRVLDETRALPGVANAAYISFLPMVQRGGLWPIIVPGHPRHPGDEPFASLRFVTPGFFDTLGIPVREGRDVTESDTPATQPVAVVSESFGRRHWPNEDPVGRQFQVISRTVTVVGIVGDIRVRGLEHASEPQVYLPYLQQSDREMTWYAPKDLAVRLRGPDTQIAGALRRIVGAADPDQPVADIEPLSAIVARETTTRSVQVRVLSGFAALACILAAFGIHGLLSFSVSTRTREVGVRVALGAQRRQVVGLILRRTAVLAVAGVALGAGVAYAAGRSLAAMLAGVGASDGPTFLIAVALALATIAAGSLASALRIARVSPAQAIRED